MALMWCCNTLEVIDSPPKFRIPSALGLLSQTGVAYAGFEYTVASWLKAGDQSPLLPSQCTDPLKDHAEAVLKRLAMGDRLIDALNTVNPQFPPRQIGADLLCPVMPMIIKGDPHARIVNVHLSPSEWENNPNSRSQWFFVLP